MTAAKRHDAEAKIKIAKMTKKIREDERQAEAAREYARSLKQNTKENVGIMSVKKENDESLDIKIHSYKLYSGQRFAAASRMIDMYDQNKFKKLYGNKLKDKNAVELVNDFMHEAQKAEKFKMDDINWSDESKKENKRCIEKHMQEGLGLLPFEKILFQKRGFQKRFGNIDDRYIAFHLFEYKEKDIEKNTVTYDHRALFVRDGVMVFKKEYLFKTSIVVPLDFKKNWTNDGKHFIWASNVARPFSTRGDNFYSAFIQLNSHTDKNANIRDIVPKSEKPSTSFTIREDEASQEEFVPVWKSKTVYIKPDEYRTEKDTTYTNDITDDEPHEKRYVPYHSVRGHTRRLRKGDITSVRAHFRGHKEYGAIHKNYVLAAPRIIRKGKAL